MLAVFLCAPKSCCVSQYPRNTVLFAILLCMGGTKWILTYNQNVTVVQSGVSGWRRITMRGSGGYFLSQSGRGHCKLRARGCLSCMSFSFSMVSLTASFKDYIMLTQVCRVEKRWYSNTMGCFPYLTCCSFFLCVLM